MSAVQIRPQTRQENLARSVRNRGNLICAMLVVALLPYVCSGMGILATGLPSAAHDMGHCGGSGSAGEPAIGSADSGCMAGDCCATPAKSTVRYQPAPAALTPAPIGIAAAAGALDVTRVPLGAPPTPPPGAPTPLIC